MRNPGQPGGGYRVRGLSRLTADGMACDAGSQTELVFRLNLSGDRAATGVRHAKRIGRASASRGDPKRKN